MIVHPIILGSNSPRRKQLLEQAGYNFSVHVIDVPESYPQGMAAKEIASYLSLTKAKAYEELSYEHIIITADSIVISDGDVLGKPRTESEALSMLRRLSGRAHTVLTGVTLCVNARYHTFREVTQVFFRSLKEEEIKFYVDKFKPLDKAGAYGIQEWIGLIGITRIEGDYYNVMGLPVCRLKAELDKFLEDLKLLR